MIGERIKEERMRLGFTQPVLAEQAGAKKRTLIDWEKGVSSPTALQLQAMADVGLDVQYVVTGKRSAVALDADPELNELVRLYRSAPLAVKGAVLGALTAGAAPASGSKVVVRGSVGKQINADSISGGNFTVNMSNKEK